MFLALLAGAAALEPDIKVDLKPVSAVQTVHYDFYLPPQKGNLINRIHCLMSAGISPLVPVHIKYHGTIRGGRLPAPATPQFCLELNQVIHHGAYEGPTIVMVDKADWSFGVPNTGGFADFNLTDAERGEYGMKGTLTATVLRPIEPDPAHWREKDGKYLAEFPFKTAGDYAVECGISTALGGLAVRVPSHLVLKMGQKVLYDKTAANHRLAVHYSGAWLLDPVSMVLTTTSPLKEAKTELSVIDYPTLPKPTFTPDFQSPE